MPILADATLIGLENGEVSSTLQALGDAEVA